jgi:hypothetical protein
MQIESADGQIGNGFLRRICMVVTKKKKLGAVRLGDYRSRMKYSLLFSAIDDQVGSGSDGASYKLTPTATRTSSS